ncbi:MAG TPA: uroporphyrinogen-III C-methyltransferase, partial [Alphaproteobacteria bacterium]|nr:uroporphyrinogen-III C-methyltransferase [Alphaproteobacteria bacterium]
MDQLPVFLNVKDRRILVVGGGTAAARKVELASRAGAAVTVFAPAIDADLRQLMHDRDVEHRSGPPTAADLKGCLLAFAASDDRAMNERARALAVEAGVPVNVVDRPDLCDFTMPAILDRESFVVAISSGGDAPLLSRMLKARFETIVPWAYGRLARFAGSWRARVKQRLPDFDGRRRFWEDIFDSTVAELVFAGREADAEQEMRRRLDAAARAVHAPKRGEVYLVGAGPGDPDLLTFRALRLMQRAEVVLYDRLIGEGILNLVRRDAERIYVGKAPNNHTLPQEEISALMVRLARDGKRVLRLKGGDPFIFGRGGEEIEALAEHDIPLQVVPGVTAASGCAAYA